MRSSKMNKKIRIENCVEVKNDEGVYIKMWTLFASSFAYIKPISGSQVFTQQATEHKATIKVNIRYLKGLEESMRVVIDGIPYEIDYIEDVDYRHVEQWLTLKKVI